MVHSLWKLQVTMGCVTSIMLFFLLQTPVHEGVPGNTYAAKDPIIAGLLVSADSSSDQNETRLRKLKQANDRSFRFTNDHDRMLVSWHLSTYYTHINTDSSVFYLRRASDYLQKVGSSSTKAIVSIDLGHYYRTIGYFDRAASMYESAYEIYKTQNDSVNIWWTLHLVGLTLYDKMEYRNAIKMFERARTYLDPTDYPRLVNSSNSIALSYFRLKEYQIAEEYYNQAYKHVFDEHSIRFLSPVTYNLGRIYIETGRYNQADFMLETAYSAPRPQFPIGVMSGSRAHQARLERLRGNINKAEYRLFQADSIMVANLIEDHNVRRVWLQEWSLLAEAKGDLRKSLVMQRQALQYADSLSAAQLSTMVSRLKNEYELEFRDRVQAELQAEEERQRQLYILTILLLIVSILIITFLFFSLRGKHKHNIELIVKQMEIEKANKDLLKTNADLQLAKRVAEIANAAKSNFLSIMSHEIRTPLNALIGATNFILTDSPPDKHREFLDVLRMSSNNLLYLVNNILDLGRLESGKVQPEKTPFNLRQLIQGLHSSFSLNVREKDVVVKFDFDSKLDENVSGDPYLLGQVVQNLLSNAVKFTESGMVKISLDMIEKKEHRQKVRFAISDTGIGIPRESQKVIFDNFAQASADTNRKFGGSGLGLAICSRIVKLLGSTIELESHEGVGSTFMFDLDFDIVKASEQVTKPSSVKLPLDKLRVLIVEDNEFNIVVLRRLLERWHVGYIDTAHNGLEALDKVHNQMYDVILTDIHMPEMDGFEATRRIRAIGGAWETIPIYAISADVQPETRDKAIHAGVNDVITKPFTPDEVYSRLYSALVVLER
jgi:signal transduction histidine kinase/ActR/RegA family two-component response regulator